MTHDYQPEWDYNTVGPDQHLAAHVRATLTLLSRYHVYQSLGLSRPRIAYVNGELNRLAKYVDGTKTEPVIILDIKEIREGAKRYNLPLALVVETTIVHELAHAFEDSTGKDYSEKSAEEFAERFYHFREMSPRYAIPVSKAKRHPQKKQATTRTQVLGIVQRRQWK